MKRKLKTNKRNERIKAQADGGTDGRKTWDRRKNGLGDGQKDKQMNRIADGTHRNMYEQTHRQTTEKTEG
jgi:hypothetical protein